MQTPRPPKPSIINKRKRRKEIEKEREKQRTVREKRLAKTERKE
jgi:hypothetical protein